LGRDDAVGSHLVTRQHLGPRRYRALTVDRHAAPVAERALQERCTVAPLDGFSPATSIRQQQRLA
jgi:hypothetical protein